MSNTLRSRLLLSCALAVTGCTQSPPPQATSQSVTSQSTEQALRDVGRNEAIADFESVVTALDGLYGPMARKKSRYGLDLTRLELDGLQSLAKTRGDSATFRATAKFLHAFHDGHVSFSPSVLSDGSRQVALPLLVAPVEGRYLVYAWGDALVGQVTRGDELVRIDNVSPQRLVELFGVLDSVPRQKTAEALAAYSITFRSFMIPERFLPTVGAAARLEFRRADGSTYTVQTPWLSNRPAPRLAAPARKSRAESMLHPQALASDQFQDVIRAQSGDTNQTGSIGSNRPFFLTNSVVAHFGITPVRPSDERLSTLGVTPCTGSNPASYDCYRSFAGTYTYQGKRVLLVRIPSYETSADPGYANDVSYLRAVLADYQDQSDVLVLDDTNNPGGEVNFALTLFSSLISAPATNVGFAFHADRRSVNDLRSIAEYYAQFGGPAAQLADRYFAAADATERAYDAHQPLGPLVPLVPFAYDDDRVMPDSDVHWAKPIVVLTNELSFSGGDLFPMIVKNNHVGTIFGQTTAGLGGNVEEVLTTTYSQATLRVTRSLYAPMDQASQVPFGTLVEDQGVTPDVPHQLTVADFRAGYVDYVEHFSATAVGLLGH